MFMKLADVIEKLNKLLELKGKDKLLPIDYNLVDFQETDEEKSPEQREIKMKLNKEVYKWKKVSQSMRSYLSYTKDSEIHCSQTNNRMTCVSIAIKPLPGAHKLTLITN